MSFGPKKSLMLATFVLLIAVGGGACGSDSAKRSPSAAATATATASVGATAAGTPLPSPTGSLPAPTDSPQPTLTASARSGAGDAIGFCATYGTIDFPAQDPRYDGTPLPLQIMEILRAVPSPTYSRPSDYYVYTAWRCLDGRVYACVHEYCDYAPAADPPNDAMEAYCRQNPDASYITDEVVGAPPSLDYQWVCVSGAPTADRRRRPLDTRGFYRDEWVPVPEPNK